MPLSLRYRDKVTSGTVGGVLTLRPATPADADAMATTVSEGFAFYRTFAPPGWEPPDRLEFAMGIAVRLQLPDMRGWIAEDDGAVAGHVTWLPAAQARLAVDDPGLAHLEQLFVRRSHWGTRAASTLVDRVKAEAAAAGFTAVRLATPLEHARALRFYEREGFTPYGEPLTGEPIGLPLIELRAGLR